jgi:tyrosyl-tRNA synthetase
MLPSQEAKAGDSLVQILVAAGLVGSNSEARRMFAQNAITLNGNSVGENYTLKDTDAIASGHAIVKKGKNKYAIVKLA